jgi:hypothetical protein
MRYNINQLPSGEEEEIIDVEAEDVIDLSPLLSLGAYIFGGTIVAIPLYYIGKFLIIIIVGLFTCIFLGC